MKINLKKRCIYVVIGLSILLTGVFAVNAVVNKTKDWHSADNILISMEGFEGSLQQAIDEEYSFINGLGEYSSEIPDPGHSFSNILIIVDGHTMTLQEAIVNNVFVDGATQSYTTEIPTTGHLASEIEISSEKSLQDSIDTEEFLCVPNCTGKECGSDGCIENCGNCAIGEQCYTGKCCQETGDICETVYSPPPIGRLSFIPLPGLVSAADGDYMCGEVIIGWESGITEEQKYGFIEEKELCVISSLSLLALPVGREPPEACEEYVQSSIVQYCEPNYVF